MRRTGPALLDEDLVRLARLGGAIEQIAEAAGADAAQVRRRLVDADRRRAGSGAAPAEQPV